MTDTDLDRIRFASEVVGRDPFATLLGIEIKEVRDSFARASLKIKEEYCNARVRTHGGVIFSLADQAFAVAVHARGIDAFALELKINYFLATGPGQVIFAEASPIDVRNRVSLWNIDITNEAGERVASAQGLAYHLQ